MHTHEIHIAGAQETAGKARDCLFAFPEVLDVLITSRRDSLIVVFAGRPRPAEWSDRLRAAGLRVVRPTLRQPPEAALPKRSPSRPPRLAARAARPRSLGRSGDARAIATR
jgi:hypothetical protein